MVEIYLHILDNSSQTLTRMQCLNRTVSLVHTLKVMCDKVINRELSFHTLFHQHWNIPAALEAPKSSSLPDATGNQLERAGADLMTRRCHTNDTRATPTTVRAFKSSAHDGCVSGTVKGVVDTPLGHGAGNVLLDWCITQILGVNTVCGA